MCMCVSVGGGLWREVCVHILSRYVKGGYVHVRMCGWVV